MADDVWSAKHSKQELQQLQVINSLKAHIERSNERIAQMQKAIHAGSSPAQNTADNSELYAQRRQAENELIRARCKLEDLKCQLKVKSDIFAENKGWES